MTKNAALKCNWRMVCSHKFRFAQIFPACPSQNQLLIVKQKEEGKKTRKMERKEKVAGTAKEIQSLACERRTEEV